MDQLPDLLEQRAAAHGPRLWADQVKFFLDGVIENFAALMLEPYLDAAGQPTENLGIGNFASFELNEVVAALDREGFAAHFHAIGDGAVRQALDAVAAARAANGASDARHHIAHIELIHPDDIGRFSALGVAANMQPYWAVMEDQMRDLRIPFLGPIRTAWQFPFASLHRAGARLVGGSDWDVTTANPLEEIEVAMRRVWPGQRSADPFLPDERLDLDTSLVAFTIGSAWVNRWETDTGTLEVGKRADLLILDRNLRSPDTPFVGDARVRLTMIEGHAVYEA
jgi:predicted amidohydrolase YtcJ